MPITRETKLISIASLLTLLGLMILRIVYFLSPQTFTGVPHTETQVEYRFIYDQLLILPDFLLMCGLLLTGVSLLRRKRWGPILVSLCSLYLIYLGVIDFALPSSGVLYAISIVDVTANGAINLWCIVFGLYSLLKMKKLFRRPTTESAYNHHKKKIDNDA